VPPPAEGSPQPAPTVATTAHTDAATAATCSRRARSAVGRTAPVPQPPVRVVVRQARRDSIVGAARAVTSMCATVPTVERLVQCRPDHHGVGHHRGGRKPQRGFDPHVALPRQTHSDLSNATCSIATFRDDRFCGTGMAGKAMPALDVLSIGSWASRYPMTGRCSWPPSRSTSPPGDLGGVSEPSRRAPANVRAAIPAPALSTSGYVWGLAVVIATTRRESVSPRSTSATPARTSSPPTTTIQRPAQRSSHGQGIPRYHRRRICPPRAASPSHLDRATTPMPWHHTERPRASQPRPPDRPRR
jgi:hypothetical protein